MTYLIDLADNLDEVEVILAVNRKRRYGNRGSGTKRSLETSHTLSVSMLNQVRLRREIRKENRTPRRSVRKLVPRNSIF